MVKRTVRSKMMTKTKEGIIEIIVRITKMRVMSRMTIITRIMKFCLRRRLQDVQIMGTKVKKLMKLKRIIMMMLRKTFENDADNGEKAERRNLLFV
jgi:hypothetical protein